MKTYTILLAVLSISCSLLGQVTDPNNPNQDFKITLSFTAISNADPGVTFTSNEATITFPKEIGTVTATLDNGSIIKNKINTTSKTTPIISGDTVAVSLPASNNYGTTTISKMTLAYGTQSTTADFSVATKAAPSGGSVGAPFPYVYRKYTSTDVGSSSFSSAGIVVDNTKIYWAHSNTTMHQINISDLSVSPFTGFTLAHSGQTSITKIAKHGSAFYTTMYGRLLVSGNTMYEIVNINPGQINVWDLTSTFSTPISASSPGIPMTDCEYINNNFYVSQPNAQKIAVYSSNLTLLGTISNVGVYQMASIGNTLYVYYAGHIDEYDVSTTVPSTYKYRELIKGDDSSQSGSGDTFLNVPGTNYLFGFGDRSQGRFIQAIDISTVPYTIKNKTELSGLLPGVGDTSIFDIAIGTDHKAYMMDVYNELYVVDLSSLF